MEVINSIYENINIYFSLIIYDDNSLPKKLITSLKKKDYPVKYIQNLSSIEKHEHNDTRIFIIHKSKFNELCFIKNNDMQQYNVIFCTNDSCFNSIIDSLDNIKPSCHENIIITKIFF